MSACGQILDYMTWFLMLDILSVNPVLDYFFKPTFSNYNINQWHFNFFFILNDREAADKVVKGEGKFEELIVCSNEIAASTAQLVVASKVKADRKSKKLSELSEASRGVTSCTGKVVGSAREASQIIEEQSEQPLCFIVSFTVFKINKMWK